MLRNNKKVMKDVNSESNIGNEWDYKAELGLNVFCSEETNEESNSSPILERTIADIGKVRLILR